jgi:hypothetical protein
VIAFSGHHSGHSPDLCRDLWHPIVLIDRMNRTSTVTIIS